jgi:hypothetical protein
MLSPRWLSQAGRARVATSTKTSLVVIFMWYCSRPQPARSRAFRQCQAAGLMACFALCCLMSRPAAADGIAPGEWKLTETIVMNGNKTPAQTRTRCLSPEQAADTAATFSPEYRTVNSGCERVEFNSSATALHGPIGHGRGRRFHFRHAQALFGDDRVERRDGGQGGRQYDRFD